MFVWQELETMTFITWYDRINYGLVEETGQGQVEETPKSI
jgi:hypothetical protein